MKRPAAGDTSCRYWRNYISFFFDLDVKRLLYGVEGRDRDTVSAFADDLSAHGGDSEQIRQVCCDMWPAYISGVKTFFPNAEITFDRFHIIKIMNQAVDEVRRQEAKTTEALKKTRYLWLKNPANLSDKQRLKMDSLAAHNLKTARAYQIRLTLQEFFEQPNREVGEAFLKRWYFWATHSRLEPIIQAAKTIKHHWEGVLNWFDSLVTIGLLEGYNSLVQAAKARARGYRTNRNLITMGYLIAGQLKFNLPT
jgi:transposase